MDYVVTAWIFNEKKVLLIFHKKHKQWLPVGGHIEKGESFHEAIKREIKEEVGLDVHLPIRPVLVSKQIPSPEPFNTRIMDHGKRETFMEFHAISLTREITPLDAEIQKYDWFSLEEIEQHPEMTEDLKTIARLAFVNLLF